MHGSIYVSYLQEMKKVVDLINYEIEYVLRPRTAPMRYIFYVYTINSFS